MTKENITSLITSFFTVYLPNTRGYSVNTISSYRDTFVLFFEFANSEKLITKGKITSGLFSQYNVSSFLEWLEEKRGSSISTRNQRLAAIKSFCKYVSMTYPDLLDNLQQIVNIIPKKNNEKTVDYLSVEAISVLLKQPDTRTKHGIRDLAILSILYETGCRVQELINLKLVSIRIQVPATVTVLGKGRKTRVIPVSQNMVQIIEKYTTQYRIYNPDHILFFNNRGEPLTRAGIGYILDKYVDMAKGKNLSLFGSLNIHPHVLRHSKAMHLLESNINLIYIRDFLGHTSVTTTEIYAKANPEIKRKYLEKVAMNIDTSINKFNEDEKESLLDWLKQNI